MSAKGRVKCRKKHLPSLLEQMLLPGFDERSEPGKPKVFRVSARNVQKTKVFQGVTRNVQKPKVF